MDTILLVEDDENDVQLVRRAFQKANLPNPLQVVTHGEEACAYLAGEGAFANRDKYPLPILVLLDLKLPRKSGLEVLRWLRDRADAIRRLPVVVLTSSREVADVNGAYDIGANSYLCKPVEFDDLQHLMETVNRYWLSTNEHPDVGRN